MPKLDSAARRHTLLVWQDLGRNACRAWYEQTGQVSIKKYRGSGAAHRAYIDGWNSEVAVIRAEQAPQINWEI